MGIVGSGDVVVAFIHDVGPSVIVIIRLHIFLGIEAYGNSFTLTGLQQTGLIKGSQIYRRLLHQVLTVVVGIRCLEETSTTSLPATLPVLVTVTVTVTVPSEFSVSL